MIWKVVRRATLQQCICMDANLEFPFFLSKMAQTKYKYAFYCSSLQNDVSLKKKNRKRCYKHGRSLSCCGIWLWILWQVFLEYDPCISNGSFSLDTKRGYVFLKPIEFCLCSHYSNMKNSNLHFFLKMMCLWKWMFYQDCENHLLWTESIWSNFRPIFWLHVYFYVLLYTM